MKKKLHIGIIGSNGNLGSDLLHVLQKKYRVSGITKENYSSLTKKTFDVLINANGNSKRFLAIQNPHEDFKLSTISVLNSLFDFRYKKYIYISSSDVYKNHTKPRYTKEDGVDGQGLSAYGFHKYLSELLVRQYASSFIILRCSMMLGRTLRKGPIFDLLHNTPLFVSKDSKLQMITTDEVANVIQFLLDKKIAQSTLNVGGKGTVSFSQIENISRRKVTIQKNAEKQVYEMDVSQLNSVFPLKPSKEYLQIYLNTIQ